jgi:Zn-dependent protease with chaperone function
VIFAARGVLVSLAFFAVVYCLLSLMVVLAWRITARKIRRCFVSLPNFLFGLRIFSFAVSAVVTVFFTFPSFWLMERLSPDEDAATFVLAVCSVVILSAGIFRVLRTQARTTHAVAQWLGVTNLASDAGLPVLSASDAPALILVGIRRPKVMVSHGAATVLSNDELQVAVRHELGHRHSWDNLKKVLISATPFPGMGGIESAWREAAELAADDSAVTNRREALDLAAALIKLSRSSPEWSTPEWSKPLLATGLVSNSSSISLRVKRLLEWRMIRRRFRHSWRWTLLVLFVMIIGIASNYGATLVLMHRSTELLVP